MESIVSSDWLGINYRSVILEHKKSVVSSRSACDTSVRVRSIYGDNRKEYIFRSPVVCSNMKSVLDVKRCRIFDSHGWFYVYHRIDGQLDIFNFVSIANREGWNVVSISVGCSPEDLELIESLHEGKYSVDFFTIDLALSHTDNVIPIVNKIKSLYPNAYIICGNGSTSEWVDYMASLGVDGIKVGIGVSPSCRTRQYTGFGSTTVSSLSECSFAARERGLFVVSDGGLTVDNGEVWVGDVAKAIRFGADFVMSGSLFSQCSDSPSVYSGYYGNASAIAKRGNKHVEGTNIKVEDSGVDTVSHMNFILDSLRSSISYAGGDDLSALRNVNYKIVLQ
jgi:GMP reductase